MSQNEAFMAAISEDVLASEQKEEEELQMQQQQYGDGDDDDDDRYDESQDKLDTVGEGNETNQMTTDGKPTK